MKITLQKFLLVTDRTEQSVRHELVKRFQMSDQNFRDWLKYNKPVITVELDPRTFRIKKLWKGEAVLVPERGK